MAQNDAPGNSFSSLASLEYCGGSSLCWHWVT